MDYSGTLRRGWGITWQNKWLILLSLIPALSGLGFLLMSFAGAGFPTDPSTITPETVSSMATRTVLLSCGSVLFGLVVGIIGLAARGGMIAGVAGVERGEAYGFGRAFRAGWRKVLSLIGMTILLYGAVFVLYLLMIAVMVIPLAIGAIGASSGQGDGLLEGMGLLVVLAMCCLGSLVFLSALVATFIYPFAYRGIMLRDMGVVDAIRHGWRVLRENLGEILLLALPFFFILLFAVVVYMGVYFAVSFPSMMAQMNDAMSGIPPTSMGMSMLSPLFLVLYVVYALLISVITTWQSATFTLGYLQWTGKDVLVDPPATPSTPLV